MQPQSSKNNYNGAQNTGNNVTAQNRSNQPSAGINYRQNISNLTPRNRYAPATTIFPTVHPSVVMGQFYAARPPALQYAPQYYPPNYYPYYQQLTQQQQQPPNGATGAGNPLASLNTVMAVQPGGFMSGPIPAGNRAALPFTVTPGSSVLNVNTNNAAQAVAIPTIQQPTTSLTFNLSSVSPSPMLAAATTTTASPIMTQNQTCLSFATTVANASIQRLAQPHAMTTEKKKPMQTKAKIRSHALQIIHPITNKNILQDLNKDMNKTLNNAMPQQGKPRTSASFTQIIDRKPTVSKSVEVMQNIKASNTKKIYKDATQQAEQKSIVSAMAHHSTAGVLAMPPLTQANSKNENLQYTLSSSKSELLLKTEKTSMQQLIRQQQVVEEKKESREVGLTTVMSNIEIEIVDLPVTKPDNEKTITELSETPKSEAIETISVDYSHDVTTEVKPLEIENKEENYAAIGLEDLDPQSDLSIADITENDADEFEVSSQMDLENGKQTSLIS